MKYIHFLLLIAVMLQFSCEKKIPAPDGLMVDFIRIPDQVTIRDPQPEFSWVLDESIKGQSAFQILVASSEEMILQNEADAWNSGKIQGNSSTEVEYDGKKLTPGAKYFWKVKCWDQDNNETRYSDIQVFSMNSFQGYSTTPNNFQTDLIDPVKQIEKNPGHRFIDFGKAAFGTLILQVETTQSDSVIVHLGEKLSDDSEIDRNPPGTVRYMKVKMPVYPETKKYLLELPPDPRNTNELAVALPDSFPVIMPFRYCELEFNEKNFGSIEAKQKTWFYYFDEDASFFSSSDTLLNQIWDLCKYSIKATSFTGYYIDGDRERIPYEADAIINQLGHYCTDREYSMARRTNEYFIDHPTWPTEWILQTLILFYNDYLYTGNLESITEYYAELRHKTLIDLAREDGLITTQDEKLTDELMLKLGFSNPEMRIRDIVDWPPSQTESSAEYASIYGERDNYDMVAVNTVVNSFHYLALKLYAEMAGLLNKTEDSVLFANQATLVKSSINQTLFDSEQGVYIDGEGSEHSSLHANMMPLAFGIVPDNHRKTVIEFIKSKGMACSVYGSQFLMDALYEAGEGEYAFDLLTSTSDRSWWNMIRTGSTITMEAWDMIYKPNSDWNHAWGAAPANSIPRGLWGIQPLEPGFTSVEINPQMAELRESSIKFPTIKGSIFADYKINNDSSITFKLRLPGNMRGRFIASYNNIDTITLNGEKLPVGKEFYNIVSGESIFRITLQ